MKKVLFIFLFLAGGVTRFFAQEFSLPVSDRPESEITAAANPTDPDNMILATMRDYSHLAQGKYPRLALYYTTDQGRTWSPSAYQGVVEDKSSLSFIGDPVLTFDSYGTAYLVHAYRTKTLLDSDTRLYLATSTDQGKTWTPQLLASDLRLTLDKPWIASDLSPESPFKDNVYMVYLKADLFSYSGSDAIFLSRKEAGSSSIVSGSAVKVNSKGYNVLQFPSMSVDGQGRIFVSFLANDGVSTGLFIARSDDGGKTFLPEIKVTSLRMYTTNLELSTAIVNKEGMDRLYPCPEIKIDRFGGAFSNRIYFAWTDLEEGTDRHGLDVFLSYSDDQGATWSAPKPIHSDGLADRHQCYSAMEIAPDGTLLFSWYDRRDDPQNYASHLYFGRSRDGGATLEEEIPISTEASDFSKIGDKNNHFGIGEYHQIVISGSYAFPFWADGRSNNGDIRLYAAQIDLNKTTSIIDRFGSLNEWFSITSLFPNPAQERARLTLELKAPSPVILQLESIDGKITLKQAYSSLGIGEHQLDIPVHALPEGIYFCRVGTEFGTAVVRMIVAK